MIPTLPNSYCFVNELDETLLCEKESGKIIARIQGRLDNLRENSLSTIYWSELSRLLNKLEK